VTPAERAETLRGPIVKGSKKETKAAVIVNARLRVFFFLTRFVLRAAPGLRRRTTVDSALTPNAAIIPFKAEAGSGTSKKKIVGRERKK